MEEKSKNYSAIIAILVIIIIALLVYIVFSGKTMQSENTDIGNKPLTVLDDITLEGEGKVILKVQNTSSKTFNNVSPVLIYYNVDGMPIHEGWASRVGYFAPGEIRYLEFYDTIEDYDKVELGLFDRDDKITYSDLRDKITYSVEKAETPDEYGSIRLTFTGKNEYDKDISTEFQIAYYSGDKLIYEDQFGILAKANSTFEEYEYYMTEFFDGTKFPEGYTYEVTLSEAIEYVDVAIAEEEDTSIDFEELDDDEKIEHALHILFKEQYGDKLDSAKIVVDKMYTAKEVEADPTLKSLNIKEGEIPFEVSIDFLPAEGADPNVFTIPNGEYDKASGWVHNASRLGILTPDETASGQYKIRNLGTGW